MAKARSARGVIVDFDLLKIKQQLAQIPPSKVTLERRKFIDQKDAARRVKKAATEEDIQSSFIDTAPVIEQETLIEEPKNESKGRR